MKTTAVLVGLALLVSVATVESVELTIFCGGIGAVEEYLCEQQTREWAARTGHDVKVLRAPDTTEARYQALTAWLGAADPSVDVVQIDVIWPSLLADHLLDLQELVPQEEIDRHVPAIVANNRVDGRLVAMPWYAAVGLMYYRSDLLETYDATVPRTWSELAATAERIQAAEREAGRADMWGYVFQGEAYEGLTCNALEWIHSNGSFLVDDDGDLAVATPAVAAALGDAASWVGTISPPRVTGYREEDARLTFIHGNAVFMRNWPYVWNLLEENPMSPVAGKVGVAQLPAGSDGGRRASVLGGWQLAVSRYSEHPLEAVELVRHLTGVAAQRERALEGSFAPTVMSLYDDRAVLDANPLFPDMRTILERVVRRPTDVLGDRYPELSKIFSGEVHAVLEGKRTPEAALAEVAERWSAAVGDGP